MNYYISDIHFGHRNVIRFDGRPFADVDKMDRALIGNWNRRVAAEDHVWILGDFCYHAERDPAWYLEQLAGHKHLVVGNHDKDVLDSATALACLESVDKLRYLRDGGRDVILCHYPLAEWNGMRRGSIYVYGHIHADTGAVFQYMSGVGNAFNAGCMLNGYQPVTLEELTENNRRFMALSIHQ